MAYSPTPRCFNVPGQELPRVLLELRACLKPGGVLFSSNPRGNNQEGWSDGRYGRYHDLETWRRFVSSAGFTERHTITVRQVCHLKDSRGWQVYGVGNRAE